MQVPWISLIQLWEPLSIITPPVLQGLNPNLSLASPLTAALPRTFCPEETMKYSLAGGEAEGRERAAGFCWRLRRKESLCWDPPGRGGRGGSKATLQGGGTKRERGLRCRSFGAVPGPWDVEVRVLVEQLWEWWGLEMSKCGCLLRGEAVRGG